MASEKSIIKPIDVAHSGFFLELHFSHPWHYHNYHMYVSCKINTWDLSHLSPQTRDNWVVEQCLKISFLMDQFM